MFPGGYQSNVSSPYCYLLRPSGWPALYLCCIWPAPFAVRVWYIMYSAPAAPESHTTSDRNFFVVSGQNYNLQAAGRGGPELS